MVRFNETEAINEIEEICMTYRVNYLSDILEYNGIKTMSQLFVAEYSGFKEYPLEQKDKEKLARICGEAKKWYDDTKKYKRFNAFFINEPLN